jgi:DNA recombination protein RmuC
MSAPASLATLLPWAIALLLAAVLLTLLLSRRLQRADGTSRQEREGRIRLESRLEQLERISSRIDELHSMFMLPHVRGGIGETLLEELLRNWLPAEAFSLQHSFRGGGRADAVIKMGPYLVAVDAKFPLQTIRQTLEDAPEAEQQAKQGESRSPGRPVSGAVRRTFLGHARDIAEKYIRPEEGTLQFAIMYVPSERIYYRCFVEDASLAGELLQMHVVPTGPSALFLYLQTVAYGLRGFSMPGRAKELNALLYELRKEGTALSRELKTAAGHLKNLTGSLDAVDRRERRLTRLLDRLGGEEDGGSAGTSGTAERGADE